MSSENENIYQKLAEMRKLLTRLQSGKGNQCFCNSCNEKAIASHTLSKMRVLRLLEGKNDSGAVVVYHLDNEVTVDYDRKKLSSHQKQNKTLVQKGKLETSTFFGFCSGHDTSIFNLIDNNTYQNNPQVHFQHAYRAYSYSITKRKETYKVIIEEYIPKLELIIPQLKELEAPRKLLVEQISVLLDDNALIGKEYAQAIFIELEKLQQSNPLDNNTGEIAKKLIANMNFPMTGKDLKNELQKLFDLINPLTSELEELIKSFTEIEIAISENELYTSTLNRAEESGEYNQIKYLSYSIEGFFPIAGNFTFGENNELSFSLTFFPEKESNRTHFILSSLHPNDEQRILFSRVNIMTQSEFTTFVSKLILSQGSNVYFSPEYIKILEENDKSLLPFEIFEKLKLRQSFNLFNQSFLQSFQA